MTSIRRIVLFVLCVLAGVFCGRSAARGDEDTVLFSGRVLGDGGNGVEGATIHVAPWYVPNAGRDKPSRYRVRTTTNASGYFSVTRRVLASGVNPDRERVRIWAASGQHVSRCHVLSPDYACATGLTLQLVETVTILVHVHMQSGEPVAHTEIAITLMDLEHQVQEAHDPEYWVVGRTSDLGFLRLRALPDVKLGNARVTVKPKGRNPISIKYSADLRVGDDIHLNVVIPGLVRITGVVLEHDGTAAEGLYVFDWSSAAGTAPPDRYVRGVYRSFCK